MNVFLKAILEGAASMFANAGEDQLEVVLQKLHDQNKPLWLSCVFGGYAFALGLTPLVLKTGTKVDDAFLNAVKEAVVTNAAANGVTLDAGNPAAYLQNLFDTDPEQCKALISDFCKTNNI